MQTPSPDQTSCSGETGVDRLARVAYRTLLHQIGSAVADQARMKSEIAPIAHAREYRVGNSANSDLNSRAVIDITSDMACDRLLDRPDRLSPNFQRRS